MFDLAAAYHDHLDRWERIGQENVETVAILDPIEELELLEVYWLWASQVEPSEELP